MTPHYSQAGQDVFALSLVGREGYFIEIGSGNGINVPNGSNTKLLEEKGWKGLLIDSNPYYIQCIEYLRESAGVLADAGELDYKELFERFNTPKVIDYISLDVDEANIKVLKVFPFDDYEFKVMTYEHDMYAGRDECKERKSLAKEVLLNKGYVILCEDVCCKDSKNEPFEDWYVNPKYINVDDYENLNQVKISSDEIISALGKS